MVLLGRGTFRRDSSRIPHQQNRRMDHQHGSGMLLPRNMGGHLLGHDIGWNGARHNAHAPIHGATTDIRHHKGKAAARVRAAGGDERRAEKSRRVPAGKGEGSGRQG